MMIRNVRDARQKTKTSQTPEEARQKAKSWQLALSAIVLSSIGFLLSVIVVRSAIRILGSCERFHEGVTEEMDTAMNSST
jgi:hypothetical protein